MNRADVTDHPHDWQIPSALDAQRRAWRRSFFLALSIHIGIGAWLLSHVVPEPPMDDWARIEPMLRAGIAEEIDKSSKSVGDVSQGESAAPADAGEPIEVDIRGGIERAIAAAAESFVSGDAINRLSEQAKVLEQVSNSQEVAKMTSRISEAMGLKAWPDGATSRPVIAGEFDFDKALLLDITREERGDTVTIRQVLGTRDGARAIIESRRRMTETGLKFEQRLIESPSSKEDDSIILPIDAEEFAAVEARQKPYELIRQYPLVQQLHKTAVLPLIEKLSEESGAMGVIAP